MMSNSQFVIGTLLHAPFVTFVIAFLVVVPAMIVLDAEIFVPILFGLLPAAVGLLFALLNADWGFHLSESQDGFRLDRGLLQTRHETIPRGRIQAIRISQPWLWRWLGWYAIGVDVARQTVSRRTDREAQSLSRWLAPVVDGAQLEYLLARVCPGAQLAGPAGSRVPPRAVWVIPFNYVNAAAWFDDRYLYARPDAWNCAPLSPPTARSRAFESSAWPSAPPPRSGRRLCLYRGAPLERSWLSA